jgi:hypothetical protein
MKHLKTHKQLNEGQENLNISDVMKRSLEYYRYIDVMSEKSVNKHPYRI